MEVQIHNYKSVHDYMDALFDGGEPSEDSIIKAKKDYWRAYNTRLIQRRRKQMHEFSVSFNKKEFAVIQTKMGKDKIVAKYIKAVVLNDLFDGTTVNLNLNTVVIEQQLFLIAEYLQDLLEIESPLDSTKYLELSNKVTQLQELIERQYDNKE